MFNVNKKVLSISDNPGLLCNLFMHETRGHKKNMSFPKNSVSRPQHKDVVTSTKRSRGHDIILRSHKLI